MGEPVTASSKKWIGDPVSILVPACNEAADIERVLTELVDVVYRDLPAGSELLVNEGGSTDGTKQILQTLSERWPFLSVEYRDHKEGFAAAARALYRRASCPLLFFCDSDGQCVAEEFWKLAKHVEDYEFVQGVKRVRRDPFLRRSASRVFNCMARALFGFGYRDINYGFRLCRREALLDCLPLCTRMPMLLNAEMSIVAHARGHRIKEVLVQHRLRLSGISRGLMPRTFLSESWRAVLGLLALRRDWQMLQQVSVPGE